MALAGQQDIEEIRVYTDTPLPYGLFQGFSNVQVCFYPDFRSHHVNKNIYSLWLREILLHPGRYKSIKKIRESLSYLRNESKKADYLLSNHNRSEKAVYYAFWADSEALILSLLKRNGLKNLMITRMHGYDLYEELDGKQGLPWRWFLLNYIDLFITISLHGLNYFTQRYPQTKSKTDCFYLGIEQSAGFSLNKAPDKGYHVVSCGWVYPHKNVFGIFEALKGMPDAYWEHFGDGDDFSKLKALVNESSTSLSVNLPGKMDAKSVFDKYSSESYTCFLSLSNTEGLPVSMMEAMAFGIPLVSTNVGGCAEIVNEDTGVLLPDNYTEEDVRQAIRKCADNFSSPEARKRIQELCRTKFDANINADGFIRFLKKENEKHWHKLNDSK